jgi:hypothetical protein
VTFKAFDGIDIDKEIVLIQVKEAGNQAPVFDSIPSLSIVEGDTLIDIIMAHDPDTLPVTITFDSLTMPVNFSYVDSGNGVASFIFAPDYCQSDTYYLDVIVSDGTLADTATMTIEVVEAGNQPPTLNPISDTTVVESHTVNFTVTATDPDCTKPLLQIANKPAGATFPTSAYGSAVFNWKTGYNDSGTYVMTFYAIDSLFPSVVDSQLVTITVVDSNRAPYVFVPNMPDTLWEGDTLRVLVTAWDEDGPTPTIRAYLNGTDTLAANMSFYDSTNGHGVLTFAPDYSQGNENPTYYYVVFQPCDSVDPGLCRQSSTNTIKVYNANQPPQMTFSAGTGPFNITEGDSLVFTVVAADPDGPAPTLDTANFPANATWQRGAQNFGTFRFYPSYVQAGQYFPKFIATDNHGLADTQIIEINVAEAGNQRPYFTTNLLDTIDVFAGIQTVTNVGADDPDLDLDTLTASPILAGAKFDISSTPGNIKGTYTYTPATGDIDSVYTVTFIVTDPAAAADTLITHYHVHNFLRGDADSDYKYTMNDIVYLINYLLRNGPEPEPLESGDVDHSGEINVSDITYLINYLYKSGPRPPQ